MNYFELLHRLSLGFNGILVPATLRGSGVATGIDGNHRGGGGHKILATP
jgi:hypothetical protein